jgi:hypothetical protein
MHNNWIRKEYKITLKDNKSFYFNPWNNISDKKYPIDFIHMRNINGTTVYQVRYSYDMKNKILTLLDDVKGKEIVISYFFNLQDERKLKLQKINEGR